MKTNRLVNRPQCGGFGFTSTPVSTDYEITVCRAKTCELCHGAGVIEAPMTNADRIRAMTDEELVELHYSSSAHCIADDPTVCDRHDFIGNLTPCEQCYLKWLQQPAEEDDHE